MTFSIPGNYSAGARTVQREHAQRWAWGESAASGRWRRFSERSSIATWWCETPSAGLSVAEKLSGNATGAPSSDPASAAYIRRRGRDFIISLFGTLRAIKLYPVRHTAVQKSLTELAGVAQEIVLRERELELRLSGEFIFINATRLRLDLTNYASFGYLLRLCRECGVGR